MLLEPLTAVSSVDGRYRATAATLAGYFSEYALMRNRLVVECEYLRLLSSAGGVDVMRPFTGQELELLRALADLSIEDAHIIKKFEQEGYEGIPATNHDVKAVEYFMKLKLRGANLEDVLEWVHFALTSEDVNSVAHALALRDATQRVMLPSLEGVVEDRVPASAASPPPPPYVVAREARTVWTRLEFVRAYRPRRSRSNWTVPTHLAMC